MAGLRGGLHLCGKGAAVFVDELSAAVDSGMCNVYICNDYHAKKHCTPFVHVPGGSWVILFIEHQDYSSSSYSTVHSLDGSTILYLTSPLFIKRCILKLNCIGHSINIIYELILK